MSLIPPKLHVLGDENETRFLEHFRVRTAPQLAGVFPTELWSTLLLRATFHEPVIKHGVLALSSLHERFCNEDESILNPKWEDGEGGYALSQYNQAIRHMLKPAEKGPYAADVCLLACMLFSCFEVSAPLGAGKELGSI